MLIVLMAVCCGDPLPEDRGRVIAEVYREMLYEADLAQLELGGLSHGDSIFFVEAYIDTWVRTRLKIRAAENTISDPGAIDKMVREYRESLLIHRLEEEYLARHLDTVISNDDLQTAYRAHFTDFILSQAVYRGRIIFCPADDLHTDSLKAWLTDTASEPEEIFYTLQRYRCDYAFFEDEWKTRAEVEAWLGKPFEPVRRFATDSDILIVDSGAEIAGLVIFDLVSAGEPAPPEHISDRLSARILKERRREILNALHEKLYIEALSGNHIKFYNQ